MSESVVVWKVREEGLKVDVCVERKKCEMRATRRKKKNSSKRLLKNKENIKVRVEEIKKQMISELGWRKAVIRSIITIISQICHMFFSFLIRTI